MPKGIMPAFIHYRGVPQLFMESIVNSYRAGVFQHMYTANTSSMTNKARTLNGEAFLESDAEWILLLDTDMVWEPDAVIALRKFAEKKKVKAVSGWALMYKGGVWPHAFALEDGHYVPYGFIEPDSEPIKVDAAGGACFLVHREVYEAVRKLYEGKTAYVWQEEVYAPSLDKQSGEDITFCSRIAEAGYDIWYHPGAIFFHIKDMVLGPKEYKTFSGRLRELNS